MPGELKAGNTSIELSVNKSGVLHIEIPDLNRKYKTKTEWPLPVQPGPPVFHAGILHAGMPEPNWFKPFGVLKKGQELEGELILAKIKVNE